MKRSLIIAGLLALGIAGSAAAQHAATLAEAKAQAASLGKPVLVDFFAEW